MNTSKGDTGERRFWNEKLLKGLQISGILSLGIMGFYEMPGNWAFLPVALAPLLLFMALFGSHFQDTTGNDRESHAPLMTLSLIYMGICWYLIRVS